MNGTFLVVVVHDMENAMLIDRNMVDLFAEAVIPMISNQTVFVLEGGKKRGTLRPGDEDYPRMYSQIGFLKPYGIQPVIHSDDGQFHAEYERVPLDKLEAYIVELDALAKSLKKRITFDYLPKTWDEMIRCIKNDAHQVQLTGSLTTAELEIMETERRVFHYRDKLFAEQIRHFAPNYQVIFVAGAVHCVNLAAKYGWDVIRYECSEEVIKNFYTTWYLYYKFIDDYTDNKLQLA